MRMRVYPNAKTKRIKIKGMKKLLTIIAVAATGVAAAQDPQITQLHNTPLLLNPARTGLFEKTFRVAGAYRNTTFGNGLNAFQTGFLSAEARIKSNWIPADDRFGFGLFGYMDQSSAGALKSSYFGASLAYNKALNPSGSTRIGVGAQAVYVTRRLDYSKVYFEDQIGSGGVSTVPSRDAVRGGSENHMDVNVGLQLSHEAAGWGGGLGAAVNHVGRPKETFWGADYQLPVRFTGHAEVFAKLGAGKADRLRVQAVYSRQEELAYLQGGLIYAKAIGIAAETASIDFGIFGRDTRSVIPYLGLTYGRTAAAVTYDFTTRPQKQGGFNRRSLELTMTHSF